MHAAIAAVVLTGAAAGGGDKVPGSAGKTSGTPSTSPGESAGSSAATPGETGLRVSSPAFESGQPIPVDYTGDGADRSPALHWTGTPEGTVTFALLCEDPDAPMGTWTHWVAFNIPAGVDSLAEGIPPAGGAVPPGMIQGRNSWKQAGYRGPSPPPGKPHRYFFRLYALDSRLSLDSRADRSALLAALEGHVLAQAEWMGTYQR